MEWVKIGSNTSLSIEYNSDNKYNLLLKRGTNTPTILLTSKKSITELPKSSELYSTLDNYLNPSNKRHLKFIQNQGVVGSLDQMPSDSEREEYCHSYKRWVLTQLETLRGKVMEASKEQVLLDKDAQIQEHLIAEKQRMDEKYLPLFQEFNDRCNEYNFTPLQFIAQVVHGLGVGLNIEVLRAFIGFLQTYLGFKGTNVIAVGSQASGKSHILDSALRFIPEERVVKGSMTPAYFFKKYNRMDLTGYIFYIGDLGGDNSNEDTLRMRDMLKELSTDGYISRGLIDKDTNSQTEEFVTGYPALAYTTVHESYINDQEKSRSIVITPPSIDSYQLAIFKDAQKNSGAFKPVIDRIQRDCLLVQAYCYHLKEEGDTKNIDILNTYFMQVIEKLKSNEDFNRKLDEFNSILKICCILNNCYMTTHSYYGNETSLILASKQDVINALAIYDNNTLLPTDLVLIRGLLSKYEVFDMLDDTLDSDDPTYFEDNVRKHLRNHDNPDWDNDMYKGYFFTARTIRNKWNRQRWYRKSKENLELKLKRLYEQGLLIQIDYDNRDPVYALNKGIDLIIEATDLNWKKKELVEKSNKVNILKYPSVKDEYMAFFEKDIQTNIKDNNFGLEDDLIYHSIWDDPIYMEETETIEKEVSFEEMKEPVKEIEEDNNPTDLKELIFNIIKENDFKTLEEIKGIVSKNHMSFNEEEEVLEFEREFNKNFRELKKEKRVIVNAIGVVGVVE